MLNTPLGEIPLLTWLWENVLRPQGSTEPMTLGKLASLVIAIPVTLAIAAEKALSPQSALLGDVDTLELFQFWGSIVLAWVDIINDGISATNITNVLTVVWNAVDVFANALIQVLFWPVGSMFNWDDWGWSSMTTGQVFTNGNWYGYWLAIIVDTFFVLKEAIGLPGGGGGDGDGGDGPGDHPAARPAAAAIGDNLNYVMDSVLGFILVGLGITGSVLQITEDVPDAGEGRGGGSARPAAVGHPVPADQVGDRGIGRVLAAAPVRHRLPRRRRDLLTGRRTMAQQVSLASMLAAMTGVSVTQGWDAVCAMSLDQLNCQLFQAWLNAVPGQSCASITSSVQVDAATQVQLDVQVGPPLLEFTGQDQCQVSMWIAGGAATVVQGGVTTQLLTLAPNACQITGAIALSAMSGLVVDQGQGTDVAVNMGKGTFAVSAGGLGPVGSPQVAAAIADFFADNNLCYPLASVPFVDAAGYDALTPVSLSFATQADAAGNSCLLVLITTKGGTAGTATSLDFAGGVPIPAGDSATLLISSQALFSGVLATQLTTLLSGWEGIASGVPPARPAGPGRSRATAA